MVVEKYTARDATKSKCVIVAENMAAIVGANLILLGLNTTRIINPILQSLSKNDIWRRTLENVSIKLASLDAALQKFRLDLKVRVLLEVRIIPFLKRNLYVILFNIRYSLLTGGRIVGKNTNWTKKFCLKIREIKKKLINYSCK